VRWSESNGLIVDRHASLVGDTASAVFSGDRRYRYALTRRWDLSSPLACFIMLNPSTADAMADDPTIRRCTGFARAWGAGGLLVVNLFGLRATDPAELRSADDPVGPDNDAVITWWLWSQQAELIGPVVAAWGVHGTLQGRDRHAAGLLADRGRDLSCLGVTKDGNPKHPLYLPADSPLIPYPQPAAVTP
jgi:hypothetical protein